MWMVLIATSGPIDRPRWVAVPGVIIAHPERHNIAGR